jgi:chromosome segregation ATPase
MSGLEPTYTNIIKQELEIGDLRQALALVTGKLERLQQFVDRSECGQERDRLTARITELERDIEACQRSNAALLVCGAQNCEPYRELQSQLVTLEQRAQEDRIIMAMGGDQTEWYARQLATAQEERNVAIITRERVIAWRKQDQEMINGLFQQLAEWDERIKELEHTLAAQRPPEPTRSACGHYDCNEEDCYGK